MVIRANDRIKLNVVAYLALVNHIMSKFIL
jgi:hypothetical protein